MGLFSYGMAVNIGYLTPNRNFLEWRVAESDSEDDILYYLLGDKKRAIDSLDTILKSIKAHSQLMDDKQNYSISSNDHVGHLQNKDLQVYMEFTSKFKDFVDESSDKPQEGSFKV